MIEVPRAALTADQIASEADFFSFGTNDLTQMTWGFSRDDVEAAFFPAYLAQGILAVSPFESLDTEGVGSLITTAVTKGRQARPDLTLGVCGEHGGRPGLDPLLRGRRARLRLVLTVPHPRGQAGGRARRALRCRANQLSRTLCASARAGTFGSRARACSPDPITGQARACVRDLCPYLVVHPGGTIPPKGTTLVSKVRVVAMTLYAYSVLSGHYLEWGVISISVTNAAIIVAMVVVFVLALVVPFPHGRDDVRGNPAMSADRPAARHRSREAGRRGCARGSPGWSRPGRHFPTASRCTSRRGSTCSVCSPCRPWVVVLAPAAC